METFKIQNEFKIYRNTVIEKELKDLLSNVEQIQYIEYLTITGKGKELYIETKIRAYEDDKKTSALEITIKTTLKYEKGSISVNEPDINAGVLANVFAKKKVKKAITPHLEKIPALLKKYVEEKEEREVENIEIESGQLKVTFKKTEDYKETASAVVEEELNILFSNLEKIYRDTPFIYKVLLDDRELWKCLTGVIEKSYLIIPKNIYNEEEFDKLKQALERAGLEVKEGVVKSNTFVSFSVTNTKREQANLNNENFNTTELNKNEAYKKYNENTESEIGKSRTNWQQQVGFNKNTGGKVDSEVGKTTIDNLFKENKGKIDDVAEIKKIFDWLSENSISYLLTLGEKWTKENILKMDDEKIIEEVGDIIDFSLRDIKLIIENGAYSVDDIISTIANTSIDSAKENFQKILDMLNELEEEQDIRITPRNFLDIQKIYPWLTYKMANNKDASDEFDGLKNPTFTKLGYDGKDELLMIQAIGNLDYKNNELIKKAQELGINPKDYLVLRNKEATIAKLNEAIKNYGNQKEGVQHKPLETEEVKDMTVEEKGVLDEQIKNKIDTVWEKFREESPYDAFQLKQISPENLRIMFMSYLWDDEKNELDYTKNITLENLKENFSFKEGDGEYWENDTIDPDIENCLIFYPNGFTMRLTNPEDIIIPEANDSNESYYREEDPKAIYEIYSPDGKICIQELSNKQQFGYEEAKRFIEEKSHNYENEQKDEFFLNSLEKEIIELDALPDTTDRVKYWEKRKKEKLLALSQVTKREHIISIEQDSNFSDHSEQEKKFMYQIIDITTEAIKNDELNSIEEKLLNLALQKDFLKTAGITSEEMKTHIKDMVEEDINPFIKQVTEIKEKYDKKIKEEKIAENNREIARLEKELEKDTKEFEKLQENFKKLMKMIEEEEEEEKKKKQK